MAAMKVVGRTFSPPMVLSLLNGSKTQTRRLVMWKVAAGDVIYVREHWRTLAMHDKLKPAMLQPLYAKAATKCAVRYEADQSTRDWAPTVSEMENVEGWRPGKFRQAMHMPRFLSRAYLMIEEVRPEPLQQISREDAIAEGIVPVPGHDAWRSTNSAKLAYEDPRMAYRELWNIINDEDGKRWEDNPLIGVMTFKAHLGNYDDRHR